MARKQLEARTIQALLVCIKLNTCFAVAPSHLLSVLDFSRQIVWLCAEKSPAILALPPALLTAIGWTEVDR